MTPPSGLRLSNLRSALSGIAAAVLLSGCASFSPDTGMTAVADIAASTIKKDVIAIRDTDGAVVAEGAVKRLLRRTLDVEAAVQVALLSNRGLQGAYNDLALAETDLVQESLPPNPA